MSRGAGLWVVGQPASGAQAKAEAAVARLNKYRKLAGLNPVVLDAELSRGCLLHAKYLVVNRKHPSTRGLGSHKEDPKLPGHTKEGQKAGQSSDIDYTGDPVVSVDRWLASLYHRIPMLRPGLTKVGVGCHAEVVLMDVITGWTMPDIDPVGYPADGQTDVPLRFVDENPDPIPSGARRPAGYPVTLQFRAYGEKVKDVKAELRDGAGRPVKCYFSAPGKPASYWDQQNTICLIPAAPLRPRTAYSVSITATVDEKPFERKWSFTTGTR